MLTRALQRVGGTWLDAEKFTRTILKLVILKIIPVAPLKWFSGLVSFIHVHI